LTRQREDRFAALSSSGWVERDSKMWIRSSGGKEEKKGRESELGGGGEEEEEDLEKALEVSST